MVHPILHHARLEILTYQRLGVRILDYTTDVAHQLVLRDIVKELLQVYVNYPLVTLVEVFQQLQHSLLTAPAGAEAVAVLLELLLEDGT